MITAKRYEDVNKALEELIQEITVPDSKYEEAVDSYEAVGNWLSDEGSILAQYEPQIYPQGSFALGTAIKPTNGNDYDVDAVCLLQANPENITQKELKELVGNRLKAKKIYDDMIDPKEGSRRCWTLTYADSRNFHLDILPAIPDSSIQFNYSKYRNNIDNQRILITDNTNVNYEKISKDWHKSNPQGYANWFQHEMEEKIKTRSGEFFNASEAVETMPTYKRKRTLQKVVQLLKKHRNMHYGNNPDKPISIIITTLATKAYNGESNLILALQYIIQHMEDFIEKKGNVYWVENPTNSEENFADKWEKEPIKSIIFHEWLGKLKNIISDLLNENKNISESIELAYGFSGKKHEIMQTSKPSYDYISNPILNFNLPHRQPLKWPVQEKFKVSISATYKSKYSDAKNYYSNSSHPLPKNVSIWFKATTNANIAHTVEWQVVNTGEEAKAAGTSQLRGGFEPSNIGDNKREEHTSYKGSHMIQAFIINSTGQCVGRSEEFIVNIQ